MAKIIKGFMQIPSMANNAIDTIADLGELSPHSRTFAREKQYAALDTESGLSLVVFKAVTDAGLPIYSIDGTYCAAALTLINLIRNNFDNTEPLSSFLTGNLDPGYSAISYGNIITQNGIHLPESITFTHTDNDGTTFHLWLSDSTFQTEYDESETYVISPVPTITDLYQPYAAASLVEASVTEAQRISYINTVVSKYPATSITTFVLKWNDPSDLSLQFETLWTVLGHGNDPDRTDKILGAIRKYLVDNSVYTVEQWKEYFPDVETLDVFNVVPLWDKVALYEGTSTEILMRPIFKRSEIPDIVTNMIVGRTTEEVNALSEEAILLFRNMPVVLLPGSGNATGNLSFTALFPDYTIITLNDQSANALAAATREVIVGLDSLVRAAEIDNGSGSLPTGISRNLISDVSFLETSVNNIVYRMVTKASYLERV